MMEEMVLFGINNDFIITCSLKHAIAVTYKSDFITIITKDEHCAIPTDKIAHHRINKNLSTTELDEKENQFVLHINGNHNIKEQIVITKREKLPNV